MSVGRVHRGIPMWASNDVDPIGNCDLNLRLTATTAARNISQSSKLHLELESWSRRLRLPLNDHWHLTRTSMHFTISTPNLKISVCLLRVVACKTSEPHLRSTTTCTIASDGLLPTRRLRSLTPRHATRCALCVSSATRIICLLRQECCLNRL